MANPLTQRRKQAKQRQNRGNPLIQRRHPQAEDPSQFHPAVPQELMGNPQTQFTVEPTPLPDRTATQIPVPPPARSFDSEPPPPQQMPSQQVPPQQIPPQQMPMGQAPRQASTIPVTQAMPEPSAPPQRQRQARPNAFQRQRQPIQPHPTPPISVPPVAQPMRPAPTPVSAPARSPFESIPEPFAAPAVTPQVEALPQEKLLPQRIAPPGGFVIETAALKRVYKLGDLEIPALRGVNVQIGAGELVALKGRSGSGKTTLLNCIGGLDRPTEGMISVFGQEIGDWSEQKLTTWRRKQVGFIFQSLGLLPTLSAYENVELMLRIAGFKRKERRTRAMDYLELVGLGKWVDHRPSELSGGQQQRVAIARALVTSPQLLIADEPTGELDSQTGHEILSLFKSLVREQNMTMLMATHDSQADEYVDYILHMQDGEVMRDASH